ncbi:MAG: RidA family protein [Candidatus Delongbacteria bacterium]|jgi:2-iminobutanoate/2-iminopropanoate deaminase|nr:RidA family protein [Candidatus Delongbacteria bacterium]
MKRIISTSNAPEAKGPYNQAVEVNDTLYVAGQIGMIPENGVIVDGGIKAQTKQTLDNIRAILNEAGYTFGDIVKCTCFLTDFNEYKEFNEVYGEYFSADAPARSTFGISALPVGVKVKIDCIAVK